MKILLRTPMNSYTGYGNDGIGLCRALIRAGHQVLLHPSGIMPPLPMDLAMLLTEHFSPPFDMILHHGAPSQIQADDYDRLAAPLVVGWSMWESTGWARLEQHIAPTNGKLEDVVEQCKNFTHLVAYDPVSAEAFRKIHHNVVEVQGGCDTDEHPFVERDWFANPFRFCMVGQLHNRKDPFVAIQAFRDLQEQYGDEFTAELHLKNNIQTLHPAMEEWTPRLKIHQGNWPRSQVIEFMNNCHVLLAPSRGEGKNLPAVEMLASGGTVIATDFGGHSVWLRDEIGYKLNYTRMLTSEAVARGADDDFEARASEPHLAELMWHVFTNRGEAREKAYQASRIVPLESSWDSAVGRLMNAVC